MAGSRRDRSPTSNQLPVQGIRGAIPTAGKSAQFSFSVMVRAVYQSGFGRSETPQTEFDELGKSRLKLFKTITRISSVVGVTMLVTFTTGENVSRCARMKFKFDKPLVYTRG